MQNSFFDCCLISFEICYYCFLSSLILLAKTTVIIYCIPYVIDSLIFNYILFIYWQFKEIMSWRCFIMWCGSLTTLEWEPRIIRWSPWASIWQVWWDRIPFQWKETSGKTNSGRAAICQDCLGVKRKRQEKSTGQWTKHKHFKIGTGAKKAAKVSGTKKK